VRPASRGSCSPSSSWCRSRSLRARPAAGSSTQEIARFYLERDAGRVGPVGLYLVPFAGIAFLWFIAAVRSHLGRHEDQFFATVFFGSGLLFVAMLFAAAAASGAIVAAVKFQDAEPPPADTIVFARSLSFALFFVFAVRAAAVFMLVVSTMGLRTDSCPGGSSSSGTSSASSTSSRSTTSSPSPSFCPPG